MLLPPFGGTLVSTGKEVEYGTDSSHMAMNVQFMPMRISPFFLLRSRHPYPKQIRVRTVDDLNDSAVILLAELRLVGRRIRFHRDVRIIHSGSFFYQVQHFRAASHEETFPTLAVQFVHFEHEQIPSGNPFFRPRFCLEPFACLYDACPIGNQHVAFHQCLGKCLVFQGCVVRMRVDGVY